MFSRVFFNFLLGNIMSVSMKLLAALTIVIAVIKCEILYEYTETVDNPNCFDNYYISPWCGCVGDAVFTSLLSWDGENGLYMIDRWKCSKPQNAIVDTCYEEDITFTFDNASSVRCNDGFFIQQLYASNKVGINNIEKLKCCSFKSSLLNKKLMINNETQNNWDCFDMNNGILWCDIVSNTFITGFRRTYTPNCDIGCTFVDQWNEDLCCHGTDHINAAYSRSLSFVPTQSPTTIPTYIPTVSPTFNTNMPTSIPSISPSNIPSKYPTIIPTAKPTDSPSYIPTKIPTSDNPSEYPTKTPLQFTESPTSDQQVSFFLLCFYGFNISNK